MILSCALFYLFFQPVFADSLFSTQWPTSFSGSFFKNQFLHSSRRLDVFGRFSLIGCQCVSQVRG